MAGKIMSGPRLGKRIANVRRHYAPPRLEEYGRLSDLTRGEGGRLPDGVGGTQETFFFRPKQ
ncbi:MAG: lasso RiPP family leader peptide-containing protein [Chloroflexi bacterium]|nr:lasso RiPP family leader peptide-containing protein [Chloroflexota bacterium]